VLPVTDKHTLARQLMTLVAEQLTE